MTGEPEPGRALTEAPGYNTWGAASTEIISYYMDPRNFLNDKYIYQFMKQSFDSSLHTKTGLQNMVSGTFLSGTVSGGSSVSAGTGSSSGSSSSGSATGPGSSSGSSGSSAGLSSPIASISDHKTERVAATNGPGMAGDGFSSNNADGEQAQVKVAAQAKKYEKVNRDKREKIHLLSGILKCPVCGAGMYGNKSIKKRKDGSNYKDFYYYGCKHRNMTRGHKCDYKKQVHEEMLDASVAEVISNPKFSDLIRNKINMEVDTSALDQEIENYKIQLRKLYHNKDTILSDMDSLDYEDKHYQRRKTDLENHLYKTYDKIDDAEELLVSAKAKKRSLLADKITGDNIYKALVFFDKLYAQMNEAEKREFLSQLVDNVQIYEERKENGQWLKSIEFKLPIIEKEFTLSLDNDTQNETVCLLSKKAQ